MPTRHVLVVDDSNLSALKLRPRLRNLGFEVISVVASPETASVESTDVDPEVTVLDFVHEVEIVDSSRAKQVKGVLDIPVIFAAKHVQQTRKGFKEKLPVSGVSLKPFDDVELKTAIEIAFDKERHQITSDRTKRLAVKELLARGKIAAASPKKGAEEAFELLQQIPTFMNLPEKSLRQLAERSQFAAVHAGEYIVFEGDLSERSFILLSGRFAMTKTSVGGKELVVELLGPGDFFGLVLALEKLPAQLSARAQIDSEILWIQTSALMNVMEENPKLYKGFAENLAHRLHLSHNISHGLAHDSVKVRIASLLLSLVAKFARVGRELNAPVVIDITRQQIADLTGTTPESAIRMTRELQSEGLINVGSPGVLRIVDLEALTKLATM